MSSDNTPTAGTAGDDTPKTRRGRKTGPDPELLARMSALGAAPTPETSAPRRRPTTRKAQPVSPPDDAASTDTASKGKAPARKAPASKPASGKPAASKRQPAPRTTPARPMPTEQPKPVTYSARINLTTTPEQNRALELARVDDGIDKTARLRAMVALWQQDERLRRRIDKLARDWR